MSRTFCHRDGLRASGIGRGAIGFLVLVGAGTVTACSSDDDASSPSVHETQTIEADEPYANASLDELGAVSDLVVRGSVTAVEHGIELGSDRGVDYKAYTVAVADAAGVEVESVRVIVSEAMDGVPITLHNRPELSVGDEAIWCLTEIAPEFGYDGYVLVSASSVFPIRDGQVVNDGDAPGALEAEELGPEGTWQRIND